VIANPASEHRHELNEATLLVFDRRAELMDIVVASTSADEARQRVRTTFSLSKPAATHVLSLQVRDFTATAIRRVRDERDQFRA
jgi:DNA gyrase/topoisomerase IV subunit A